ncbi:MAG: AAA family ATPase [Thermoplasmata archaeon]|nr:AAA family ATPase [Thermoplasmata archaeon]MCI4362100.1 AAA family ATPase [Thermoplasmata archaeon]
MATAARPEPADAGGIRERCVTGIEGLDNILGGGIPRGNLVLVAGSVGTGKTTLCLEFLVRGAEKGERTLFLSVTEASAKLIENLSTFEFFRQDLVSSGALVFVDVPQIYDRLGLNHEELTVEEIDLLLKSFLDLVKEVGAQRVIVDSLTSVCYRIRRDERIRDFMLKLSQGLAALGCTTLLVSEIGQSAGRYSLHGVEEAIVDGVILLGNARRQGDILRILQVVKMRGTSHSRAQYVMELTPIGLLMAPHLKGGRQET